MMFREAAHPEPIYQRQNPIRLTQPGVTAKANRPKKKGGL